MSWVRVPAQAFQGGYAQHYTFYASRDQQDGQVYTRAYLKCSWHSTLIAELCMF